MFFRHISVLNYFLEYLIFLKCDGITGIPVDGLLLRIFLHLVLVKLLYYYCVESNLLIIGYNPNGVSYI